MKENVIIILLAAAILVGTFIVGGVCGVCYNTKRIKNAPTQFYEINEIVNDDYRIIATNKKDIVWLCKYNDDNTYYIAAVSGEKYLKCNPWDRFKAAIEGKCKDYLKITIIRQGKKEDNNEN